MKLLYSAANSIEAHMILNMIEQAGYKGRIDGEYLQGGLGELPALGVVRVMIDESDFMAAKEIVDKWDIQQPVSTPTSPLKEKSPFMLVVGSFIGGILSAAIYYNTPVNVDGVDYNADGKLDERWFYTNSLPSKTEVDRNLDGKIDFIQDYDRKGLLLSAEFDDNSDGIFESEAYYKDGNIVWQTIDTTGDGFNDYKVKFKFGILNTISFIDQKSKKIIKTQHYELGKLKSTEIDTNSDGELDTRIRYDLIEEISNISKIH